MDLPLYRILTARQEEYQDPSYFWNNRQRGNPDNVVFQLTLQGECFYRYGGREYRVQPGQAFLFANPEESEYGYPGDLAGIYRLQYVTFTGPHAGEIWSALRERYGPVIQPYPQGEVCQRLRDLIQRFTGSRFHDRFEESDLIYQWVMSLYRELANQQEHANPIEYGYSYLLNHYRSHFNIKSLIAEIGLSREHFTRLFRERYGVPPARLLSDLRFRAACAMLAVSRAPVEDIARSCGFGEGRAFERRFRRDLGVSPESYRDRLFSGG